MNVVVAVAAVVGAYGVLFLSAELLHRRAGWSAQTTRKLVHVAGSVLALPLPVLFSDSQPVWILAGAFIALLFAAGRLGFLPSVHGVDRLSVGAQVYPVGIAIAFTFTEGASYVIALLSLGLADTAAWAVGTHLGRIEFHFRGAVRTVEGSAAALVCAGAITTVALALVGMPTGPALIAGLGVGVAVSVAEALSPYGTDNVTIPLAASVALALMRV
jgi:phytol kinase